MTSIAFLCHANRSLSECSRAASLLEERLVAEGFESLTEEDVRSRKGDGSVLVVLGGDGFLMETMHHFGYPVAPIFGVNFGTVGFHMNPQRCLDVLPKILADRDYEEERHPVLEARVRLEDGSDDLLLAFNDVVLERQTRQSIRFRVEVDGVLFTRLAGDGFLISTPAGSTGYNLAAGGPVVGPGVGAMVATPLYPHRAAPFHSVGFSLIVPLESRIVLEADELPKRAMRVVADGRAVRNAQRVEIGFGGRHVTLLRAKGHEFIDTLSQKIVGGR